MATPMQTIALAPGHLHCSQACCSPVSVDVPLLNHLTTLANCSAGAASMNVQSAARYSWPHNRHGCKQTLQASHLCQRPALFSLLSKSHVRGQPVQSLACLSWSCAGMPAVKGCKVPTCGLGRARAVCSLSLMASYMRRSAAPTEGRTSFTASSKWRACTRGLCGRTLLAASGALLEPCPMLPAEVSPGPSCPCRCSCDHEGKDLSSAESWPPPLPGTSRQAAKGQHITSASSRMAQLQQRSQI